MITGEPGIEGRALRRGSSSLASSLHRALASRHRGQGSALTILSRAGARLFCGGKSFRTAHTHATLTAARRPSGGAASRVPTRCAYSHTACAPLGPGWALPHGGQSRMASRGEGRGGGMHTRARARGAWQRRSCGIHHSRSKGTHGGAGGNAGAPSYMRQSTHMRPPRHACWCAPCEHEDTDHTPL